jgi:hypothetical protein
MLTRRTGLGSISLSPEGDPHGSELVDSSPRAHRYRRGVWIECPQRGVLGWHLTIDHLGQSFARAVDRILR